MSRTLRIGPCQLVVGTMWDDGESLASGPPLAPQIVSLVDLKGSALYETLMAQWPGIRDEVEGAEPTAEVPE